MRASWSVHWDFPCALLVFFGRPAPAVVTPAAGAPVFCACRCDVCLVFCVCIGGNHARAWCKDLVQVAIVVGAVLLV